MSNSVTISVLMPVFNRARYLVPAIESVLSQTFKDFELLLIDDGSQDPDCRRIVKDYASRFPAFIRLLQNDCNLGPAVSRNTGFHQARGRYIALMDSDDISLPGRFEQQYQFMEAHPEIAACRLHHRVIDDQGRYQGFMDGMGIHQDALPDCDRIQEPTVDPNFYGPNISAPSCMIRASVLKEMEGYRPWFLAGSDMDFSLRLEERYPVAMLRSGDYLYRIYSQNLVYRDPEYQFYGIAARICASYRRKEKVNILDGNPTLWQVLRKIAILPRFYIREFRLDARRVCKRLLEAGEYQKADRYFRMLQEIWSSIPAEQRNRRSFQVKWKYRWRLMVYRLMRLCSLR
ncbi:MAG: glycosyltransferase family 2 protein [Gammaproteobacteria bacterium]